MHPSSEPPVVEQIPKRVTREELYRQVWKTPISRLASRYGVSDVGLRKACRKLCVPTPPRGYWARRQHGQDPPKAPLPPADEDTRTEYVFRGKAEARSESKSQGPPSREGEEGLEEKEAQVPEIDVPEIRVNSRLSNPHPLVREAQASLKEAREDRYGRFRSSRGFTVDTSRATAARALRIANALAEAADTLGWLPEEESQARDAVAFTVEGEVIGVRIIERASRSERERDGTEPIWDRTRWDYEPTGQLYVKLGLSEWADGLGPMQWKDGARRLEERLPDVIRGVHRVALGVKRYRKEVEASRLRQRQEARARKAKEQRAKAEAVRQAELEADAEAWEKSRQVRRYVEAVKAEASRSSLTSEDQKALRAWVVWAEAHANRLDPISQGFPSVFETREIHYAEQPAS
jgi:hypothetical protein